MTQNFPTSGGLRKLELNGTFFYNCLVPPKNNSFQTFTTQP